MFGIHVGLHRMRISTTFAEVAECIDVSARDCRRGHDRTHCRKTV